jgi:UrcA family protein
MIMNFRSAFRPLVLVLGAGSALGAACPGPASAATPQVTVSYQDLNLATTADVRVLYRRLKAAANDVCGNVPAAQELQRHLAYERCYNAALQDAVMKIDVPQLQAMYQGDTAASTKRG